MSMECPIHRVARIENAEAENECQTCAFFNDCPEMILSDMSEEIMKIAGKSFAEIQDAIRKYTTDKLRGGNENTNSENRLP